ncbi:MAG: glycosyltransferase, partial [Lachnospiraceae bacterium]|nr:glycosyltransferase [Lachnospiraceae bacterium]
MEKNKKRIMLIVPMLDQGGLERVCAETAQLLKKEYDVHLVVFNTTGMIYDVSGVDMIDLNMGAVEGRIGKAVNVFRRAQRVKKLKKQLGIQLSYSFGPTANLVNVLSKYKDITWAGIRGYGALDSKGSMKLICSLADRVVSCTRVMEHDIANSFRTKGIATLYNPCNLAGIEQLARQNVSEPFRTFLERPGKTIVSMGRAHDVKGFWHLIKSFYLVKKQVPELKLMIIGDGDYSAYGELAGALGIGDDVLFTGILQNPFPLLARADLYALTSQSEGFPNALIEAMACGIPCISVNCKTGPAEILQDNYT